MKKGEIILRLFQVFLSTQKADIRNERVVLVDVYMPSIRMAQVNRSVNRTVTLPAWLNAAALERNANFSQILQDALKEKFHLVQPETF